MLTGAELAVAIVMVTLGSVVLGTVSFGLGMVASPVLLLLLGAKPTIVLVNTMIVMIVGMVLMRTWRHLDLSRTKWLILGGAAGAPLGVFVLNIAEPGLLRIIIGVVIVTLGLLNLRDTQLSIATFPGSGLCYGFVTCVAVTAISIGGPLGGVYAIAQRWPTQTVRAALAAMFVVSSGLAVVLYAVTGLYDRDTLINLGMLTPGVLIGFGLAGLLVGRLNERVFRYVVIALVVIGGGMLLARELLG